jgi:N-acetylglucosaminyldiphosphoundecaprenol N-acetyl-beta-D-mannosaminyltransferase
MNIDPIFGAVEGIPLTRASEPPSLTSIALLGMRIAKLDTETFCDWIFEELDRGRGRWCVTANLDILHRFETDLHARLLYDAADVRVADGMPLVWASRLLGDPLPERVSGSALVPRLAHEAALRGRSIYLLGGAPGAALGAAEALRERDPSLKIAGIAAPRLSLPPTRAQLAPLLEEIARSGASVVFVALGSPKQEWVCAAIRHRLPRVFCIGVGATFSFLAGQTPRAPAILQRAGLEWLHRLSVEPRRLFRRYVVIGLPFAARFLIRALVEGARHRNESSERG